MVLMNRPRIVDKDLGSLGNMSSTYRDNFNVSKEISFSNDYPGFAYTKTIEPTNKKGLNNAARILYAGTTKSTHHLPGFKGHIPSNVRNSRKLEHSCGEDHHPVANNLRLTQRGMGCVLGYTGNSNTSIDVSLCAYTPAWCFCFHAHHRTCTARNERTASRAHNCLRPSHHQRRVLRVHTRFSLAIECDRKGATGLKRRDVFLVCNYFLYHLTSRIPCENKK